MDLRLAIEDGDTLSVSLKEAEQTPTLSVRPSKAGVTSLLRAIGIAVRDGYGECFWPAATGGQYWWIFTRTAESLEVVAMWSRGGVTGWEHVFRATDSVEWVR